ncbi:hypothetical protein ACFTAO_39385 [Paenibacillus rhizoplanae]
MKLKSLMQKYWLTAGNHENLYKSNHKKSPLTQELAMKELLSYALYGEPVYAQQEYCSILNKVTYEQVFGAAISLVRQGGRTIYCSG